MNKLFLFWQPPPVTRCDKCGFVESLNTEWGTLGRCTSHYESQALALDRFYQNKNGITKTCPIWQEQNKEVKLIREEILK
jgi:hypothetical protein